MATQTIVNTSAVRPRTAVLLASFALAPVVAIAGLLAATSAPNTTVTAGPIEIDSLRDFRREEIGATIGVPSPVDSLRDFRREEIGAADRGSAIDALREQRRDEFGADAP
jgi:hypothetical protein